MSRPAGALGDGHDLSERARRYANDVISGDRWPLTAAHVDLDRVTFETSTRMRRTHGVCVGDGDGNCTVRLSARTDERGGPDAIRETVRHELVHVWQVQSADVRVGHGPSFERWVDPLELSGRCSRHYDVTPADYAYRFHCANCGFIGGRYRRCRTVRAAVDGRLRCRQCESTAVDVRGEGGDVLTAADLE
ncbi:RNA polymerase subunit sigma-70 [Halorubrum sp. JWXQ-INN 858]|uniref:SprT-like domain-containing protein n=1 Tax=Halorubrum sp. JWXQ-INN 858 TaxID=2690782 RepID=UPI0013FC9A65|nr:SprT-like domain-containing protein [Halorubrum sp. JWXQ-INN 858]MWV64854.1 RNA polymerase subunit sigma-70 [Halorubrum sp. JWXQ-INN 858]